MKPKTMVLNLTIIMLMSLSFSQSTDIESGNFTDPRDGNVYKQVKIGDQIWMAENLRFITDSGSWCWENIEENCRSRGRLYNWAEAMQAPPPGWHLPSDEEWKKMEITLGLTKEQADQEGFRVDKDSLLPVCWQARSSSSMRGPTSMMGNLSISRMKQVFQPSKRDYIQTVNLAMMDIRDGGPTMEMIHMHGFVI